MRIWGAHVLTVLKRTKRGTVVIIAKSFKFLSNGQVSITTRDGKSFCASPERVRQMGFFVPGQPLPEERRTGDGATFISVSMSTGRHGIHNAMS